MWTKNSGIGVKEGLLPNLETLNLSCCDELVDEGLAEILIISRSKLRYLNVVRTNITVIGFEEEVKSLSNLETLNLDSCDELEDAGLVKILRISRSKLRCLKVSWTSITGVGFKDGVKSLPMLKNLELVYCEKLTEEGLLEILSVTGNSLKIVRVYGTSISTAVKETLRLQYTSVNIA